MKVSAIVMFLLIAGAVAGGVGGVVPVAVICGLLAVFVGIFAMQCWACAASLRQRRFRSS